MKKIVLAVVLILFMAGSVMADPPDFVPPGHQYSYGGSADVDVSNKITNSNVNVNSNSVKAEAKQSQLQGQQQGQVAVGEVSVINEKPLMGAPIVSLPENNFITGEVGRYNLLPTFAKLKQLKEQKVKGILYYSYGNVFSRITPEEIPAIILEQVENMKDKTVAYDVICKKASHTLNLGTGGAGAGSNASGYSASGIGIAGGGWAVADAYCAIWIYEVE